MLSPNVSQAIPMKEMTASIESPDLDDVTTYQEGIPTEGMLTPSAEKHMANDILNDILETAMDIAEAGDKKNKMNIIDEDEPINPIKLESIIDGLSKINVEQVKTPSAMDQQMKRILTEMMSIDNSKNLGVGDSPPIDKEYPPSFLHRPSKVVEKKTRLTDLVMNSTKAITNILNEEQRRKQDEWEEANEHVIQVIELEQPTKLSDPMYPETFPLPYDDDESELLLKPQDSSHLESIDLATEDASAGNSLGGKGDEKKAKDSKSSTLNKIGNLLSVSTKKKRWFSSFRFCHFRMPRRNVKGCINHVEEASNTGCN
ncbi:uncharacterized protein [Atheta coriaria]|uniref:uncharacterized protein n=1 Tax=Dalotia coriaria TaxID=877792 RepID=UPI0031F426FF